jgi:transposase
MRVTKRKFTLEFREEAVRLVMQERVPVLEAARRLEISDKTLANWVRAAKQGKVVRTSSGSVERKVPCVSELEMEVSKLRAENTRLKMEKEILKKATAFFVRESQ